MSRLSKAIDNLADSVPGGHLMAATGGEDLLNEAARLLTERDAEVERLTADLAAARAELKRLDEWASQDKASNERIAQEMGALRAERDGLAKALADLEYAATWLMCLRAGPRDAVYEAAKPAAWARLRSAQRAALDALPPKEDDDA